MDTVHGDAMPLEFDDWGLPCGDSGGLLWRRTLHELNSASDEEGWDQPGMLIGVLSPVLTEATLAVGGLDIPALLADHAPEGFTGPGTGMLLRPILALGDDPSADLWGVQVPDTYAAVLLRMEGWGYPPEADPALETLRPSEHPERVEVRTWLVVTRAGAVHQAAFMRTVAGSVTYRPYGSGEDAAMVGGRVCTLVARAIGVHLPPDPYAIPLSVPRYLGCLLATGVVTTFMRPVTGLEHLEQLWARAYGDRPSGSPDSATVAGAWQHPVPEAGAPQVGATLLATLTVACQLAWTATGDGVLMPEHPARDWVRELATGSMPTSWLTGDETRGEAENQAGEVLDLVALSTADLHWSQLAGPSSGARLLTSALPPTEQDVLWLGELGMQAWVGAHTGCPPSLAHAMLDEIDRVAGVAFVIEDVLGHLGWDLPGAP